MLLLAVAAITVTTSFEGGSAGRVEQIGPNHLRVAVRGQADQNHRNRQANWYYFRLDHLPQQEIELDLTDLVGEYNFRPGAHAVTRNTRPVFSYDDRAWTHFPDAATSWDDKEVRLTLRFKPERPTMWIAHMAPYTKRELDRLLADGGSQLTHATIGRTVHGRDLMLVTVTDPFAPDSGKRVVWLMARQHAWEAGTSWAVDGAVRFLVSNDPDAQRIRRATIFKIVPMFDPDGVAEGAVRFNANGYDNNRNWDAFDPELTPEIAAVRRAILDWFDAGRRIDIFLAMHNDEATDYVEGPLRSGGPRVKALAQRFVDLLRANTSFYDALSPRESFREAPIDKGRMTVNQDLFTARRIPAFLMELMVERNPKIERPRTVDDYTAFGSGLARCLAEAAGGDVGNP